MFRTRYRIRLNELAEQFRRDCERNKPVVCTYCMGIEPTCRLVPTDHGKMHPKCAKQAGLTVQFEHPEYDHA